MKAHQIPFEFLRPSPSQRGNENNVASPKNDTAVETFPPLAIRIKEEDENELIEYCRQWKIERFVILPNFQANLRSLLPPSGFVASLSRNAVIPSALFEGVPLFMRVSLFRVQTPWTSTTIPRDVAKSIQSHLQLFLRDNSTDPPFVSSRNHHKDKGWACSLGPGGAAGFYSFTGKKQQWYIMVRCGLDHVTNEQVHEELREAENQGKTLFDMAQDPNGIFTTIDRLTSDNAARIAATLARAANVQSLGQGDQLNTPIHCVPFPTDDGAAAAAAAAENGKDDENTENDENDARIDMSLRWLEECGIGMSALIPTWFCIPHRAPRGIPEAPEMIHGFPIGRVLAARRSRSSGDEQQQRRGVLVADEMLPTEITCTWNVVKTNGGTKTLFYNGCTPFASHAKPIFAWDLFQNIEVHRWRSAGGDLVVSNDASTSWVPNLQLQELTTVPVTFDPLLSRNRTLEHGNEHIHFWLDPNVHPIDVSRSFPDSDTNARDFGIGDTRIYLTPALVRHSMARPSGMVIPPSSLLTRLRVVLHEEEGYVPLA